MTKKALEINLCVDLIFHMRRGRLCLIVIKPFDKSRAVLVWSKDLYLAEGERQLSYTTFYKRRSRDDTIPINLLHKSFVSKLVRVGQVPSSAK